MVAKKRGNSVDCGERDGGVLKDVLCKASGQGCWPIPLFMKHKESRTAEHATNTNDSLEDAGGRKSGQHSLVPATTLKSTAP